jgi:hypothetical protein
MMMMMMETFSWKFAALSLVDICSNYECNYHPLESSFDWILNTKSGIVR